MLASYAHCEKTFNKARSPELGRPLHRCGLRLFKNPDASFRLTMKDLHLATITRDNVITFIPTMSELYDKCSHALAYNMHKVLPLWLDRVGAGRYRINCFHVNGPHPEYRSGIQFNLATRVCITPMADRHLRANPDARKVWLKTLKDYRNGFAVRVKLGVRGDRTAPYAHAAFLPRQLAEWMRNGEYPDELFNRVAAHVWRFDASYEEYMAGFARIIDMHRQALHREFGVTSE